MSGHATLWPSPRPDETEVMLLGTYHMNEADADVYGLDADDVLAADRQRELADLADRLVEWGPDRVCAECPADAQGPIDGEYARYRRGEDLDSLSPREELVQVGFRVSDRLDHDRVHCVDHHVFHEEYPDGYGAAFQEWWEGEGNLADLVDHPVPEMAAREAADRERLRSLSVPEFLAYLNCAPRLQSPSTRFGVLGWDDPDGARYVSQWLERNVHITRNVARATAPDDDRVLLVVGSGHVRDLRHLFRRLPGFCPVSPLSVLPDPPVERD